RGVGAAAPDLSVRRQRHAQCERRAVVDAVTLGPHAAAMRLDDLANDRQTEPEPARRAEQLSVALAEAIEDLGQEVRRDALARIAEDPPRLPGIAGYAHGDASAVRGELDRVAQHVGDRLAQSVAVSEHHAAVTNLAVELQRPVARLRQSLIDAFLDHTGDLDH